MKWLPFEAFELELSGTADEIAARLRPHVETGPLVRMGQGRAPFAGRVDERGFTLRMIAGRRDSFAPAVYGRFRAGSAGTIVRVEIIPAVAALFVVVLCIACIGQLIYRTGLQVPLLCGGGMLLAWSVCMLGFWLDGGRSRQLLVRLLSEPDNGPSVRSPEQK